MNAHGTNDCAWDLNPAFFRFTLNSLFLATANHPIMGYAADYFERENFDSASEFRKALSRYQERWAPRPADWIFRGHADKDWALNPVVFRPDTPLEFVPGGRRGPCSRHEEQIEVEFRLLRDFLEAANEQGLALPSSAEALWSHTGNLAQRMADAIDGRGAVLRSEPQVWPLPELESLFALAQHHGIPTRLLDWTRSPLVAAYFAAERAAQWVADGKAANRKLEVCAYRHVVVQRWEFWHSQRLFIKTISALGSSNPNLHAQRGLFTVVCVQVARRGESADLPAIDTVLLKALDRQRRDWLDEHRTEAPVFRRLTLPMSEAPALLRMLADEGISAHTLFPGFDGAARGVKERRYWDTSS